MSTAINMDTQKIIDELHREQEMRRRVYPNQIQAQKLTSEEANERHTRMQSAIHHLSGRADLAKKNTEDAVKELRREAAMRNKLYPRWVSDGSMSGTDAGRKLGLIMMAIDLLEPPKPKPVPPPELF